MKTKNDIYGLSTTDAFTHTKLEKTTLRVYRDLTT
jgi:hypothetical protein